MAVSFHVSGKKLREARHGAGMTQSQLARAVGTSERNIVRWENDQNAPRAEHVSAIAQATGTTVETLMESTGDDDDEPSALLEDLTKAIVTLVEFRLKRAQELAAS